MITGDEFRQLVLAFVDTEEKAHFGHRAFKVRRIFASLAPDLKTANLLLALPEQEQWCVLLPDAFRPVSNKWGARGWTQVSLTQIVSGDLRPALRCAWLEGSGNPTSDANPAE